MKSLFEQMRGLMSKAVFWYTALAGYLLVLGFLSLNPWVRPASTNATLSPDKFDHAFAYGGLAIIVYFCLANSRHESMRSTAHDWITALLISTLVGILLEVAQSFFTYNRTGSVEDAIANAIGAGLGFAVYHAVKLIRTT